MICNVSRVTTFLECRQKDAFLNEQHLIPNRTPTPLITGGAIHKGLEIFFKSGQVATALVELEGNYRDRIGEQTFVLPEEQAIYEKELKFSKLALERWAEHYESYGFTVLYPEVTFCVPLPNTLHHCYWMHKLLWPDDLKQPSSCTDPRCRIQHFIKGKCDGIVEKNKVIWLLETKSTSQTGAPFFDQWYLDLQPTAYMYGVWKATGIKPHGFIMNVIKKPNHNFRGSLDDWFARDPFERESFLRTDEDLERFEREASLMWEERERAHRDKIIYMTPRRSTCIAYQRRCMFFDLCQRHGEVLPGEFQQKTLDYVEEEYYKLAGLPFPEQKRPTAFEQEVVE